MASLHDVGGGLFDFSYFFVVSIKYRNFAMAFFMPLILTIR